MEQQATQLSIYNVTIKHGHSYVLTKSIFVVLQIVDYENLGSVIYSQTCIKRSPLGQRKSGLLRQVIVLKKFNSYEMFYDRTRKM